MLNIYYIYNYLKIKILTSHFLLKLSKKDKFRNLASNTPDQGRDGAHFKCEGGDPDLNKCAATVVTTNN